MTFARLFAVVASLHVAVIGFILVQSGCRTVSPSTDTVILKDRFVPSAVNAQQDLSEELRLPPTRPEWDVLIPVTADPVVTVCESVVVAETVTGTGSTYTVKKGDSLWAVSKRFGVSVNALASANGISNKANLKIGQTLVIPDGSGKTESIAVASHECSTVQAVMVDEPGRKYKVRAGDSLSRIAQRQHTTVAALKSINGLSSDNIRVGQELLIPGKPDSDSLAVETSQPIVLVNKTENTTIATPAEEASAPTSVQIVDVFNEDDDSFFDEDFDAVEVIPVQ